MFSTFVSFNREEAGRIFSHQGEVSWQNSGMTSVVIKVLLFIDTSLPLFLMVMFPIQVIVERAEKSDISDIDKKK